MVGEVTQKVTYRPAIFLLLLHTGIIELRGRRIAMRATTLCHVQEDSTLYRIQLN